MTGATLAAAAPRDPLARRRLTALALALLLLWPLLRLAEFNPSALLDGNSLRVMGGFLAAFVPPSIEPGFLALLAKATLETLAMATAGVAMAFVIALPLAFAVTFAAGVVLYRLVIRHLAHRPLETLLATFGVSIALQQLDAHLVFEPRDGLADRRTRKAEAMTGGHEAACLRDLNENAERSELVHRLPIAELFSEVMRIPARLSAISPPISRCRRGRCAATFKWR